MGTPPIPVTNGAAPRILPGTSTEAAEVTAAQVSSAQEVGQGKGSAGGAADGYDVGVNGPDLGPGYDAGMDELDRQIYDEVFAPNGIPWPGNASTTPVVAEQLRGTTEYGVALEAARQLDGTPESIQNLLDALGGLPLFGNIMERLLCVIKDAVREESESSKYWLLKLKSFNTISQALADQQSLLADASSELAAKEKGSDHPEKETVAIDLEIYDTEMLDENGNPAVMTSHSERVTRTSLGTRNKELDAAIEEVRNNKTSSQTQFQASDQNKNRLLQIMTQVSKTMNEERKVGVDGARL